MSNYKFAPNLATLVQIDELAAAPGKYGPQARVKGKFAATGETPFEGYAYLPGKAADVFTELYETGVIATVPDDFPDEGDKPQAVKVAIKKVFVTAHQPAGEKYPTTKVTHIANGNGGNAQKAAAPRPPASAPVTAPEAESADAWIDPIYLACARFVVRDIAPLVSDCVLVDAASLSAMIVTVYIGQRDR